jgi:hypothetical protein
MESCVESFFAVDIYIDASFKIHQEKEMKSRSGFCHPFELQFLYLGFQKTVVDISKY